MWDVHASSALHDPDGDYSLHLCSPGVDSHCSCGAGLARQVCLSFFHSSPFFIIVLGLDWNASQWECICLGTFTFVEVLVFSSDSCLLQSAPGVS